jgi:hypothetical protein
MQRDTANVVCIIMSVIIGTTGEATEGLKEIWKPHQENIQQTHYKRSYTMNITHNTESTAV